MAEKSEAKMVPTLGLTGVTVNAMALIAPGAFLWITFVVQAGYAYPSGMAMWSGIFAALVLAYATAISYSELAKLFPGAGSSYLFAEQAFLNHSAHFRFARIAKFIIGWASHLYYWVYPGVMVATMGVMVGYIVGTIAPSTMNAGIPGPVFMALIAVIFSFAVAYIAHQGVSGSTNVNIAINAIQIIALLFFSALAISYRMSHPAGSTGLALDGTTKTLAYSFTGDTPAHPTGMSVILPHSFNYVMLQATVAILLLVGFESVTALGEEAQNPKKDIPRGVLLSLTIQCLFCYLIEYFAANYFLNQGYTLADAAGSGAPLGDMMVLVGTWLFGSYAAGRAFMLIQAATVFLALIGTTLSCLSTGARVTYAMGKDDEVPSHFGLLHGKRLTPHRAIWTLATISAVIGVLTVVTYLGGTTPAPLEAKYHNLWYGFGIFPPELYAKLPNSLVITTLVSNFGTFLLYMLTCVVAIVAFREHHSFSGFKHLFVPLFGLVANLVCMLFYLVGPFTVAGMSVKEPYIALGACVLWGLYGAFFFLTSSKRKGKTVLVEKAA